MLDVIFPGLCFACESVSKNGWVCDLCLRDIKFLGDGFICSCCGVPFDLAEQPKTNCYSSPENSTYKHLCGRCLLGEFYFEKARSVAFYDGLLRDILHKFKYHGKLSAVGFLSAILIENFPEDLDPPDLVIPVPLFIDRLRKREYNQAVILGECIADYLGVPLDPFLLRRIRDTKPQFEIKGDKEKVENIKGAFSITDFDKIEGKAVLVVDDIFTTGSTLNECTRVLQHAGAFRVQALTLMRAVQS